MRARVLENNECRITQGYNLLKHRALDMVKYYSETCNITAHTEGTVVWLQTGQKNNKGAKGNLSYGNCVKIKHPNGYYTLYAHLAYTSVKLNQKVSKGQKIGYMGNTGNSYGAHLHWEVRDTKDNRINPTPYLDADLPNTSKQVYQAYDNKKNKWLPTVKIGSKDYAGNMGNPISGFRMSDFPYKAYDMVKKKWLPVVNGLSDYAGNLPNNIGAVAINGGGKLKYRVHLLNSNRWLGWVSGYNVNDFYNGFAGNLNEPIDAIQITYR